MIIQRIDVPVQPDRLPPDLVAVPAAPPTWLDVRSRWPVDDTAAVFIAAVTDDADRRPAEVTSWQAFTDGFRPVGVTAPCMQAIWGFFANGGRRAFIVPYRGVPTEDDLDAADSIDGVATVVAPGVHADDQGGFGPDRRIRLQLELVRRAEQKGDRLVLVDPPPDLGPSEVRDWREDAFGVDSEFAACYYPWLRVFDEVAGRTVFVPPSGHVAGLLAYSDLRYGVQKPPANEPVQGVRGLPLDASSRNSGDVLNPIGVNLIIPASQGIVLWGARSMSTDRSRCRLNECRSIQMIVRIIRSGTSWADGSTDSPELVWRQLHHDLTALVALLRSSGVLRHERPEPAMCVRRAAERAVLVELALAGTELTRCLLLRY